MLVAVTVGAFIVCLALFVLVVLGLFIDWLFFFFFFINFFINVLCHV